MYLKVLKRTLSIKYTLNKSINFFQKKMQFLLNITKIKTLIILYSVVFFQTFFIIFRYIFIIILLIYL